MARGVELHATGDEARKRMVPTRDGLTPQGALAGLAIMSRTELLMAVIAGLFVLETLSVLLQMSYFKLTRRLTGTGRRMFRITPIHHHFEHLGWDEVTVVIRFWIIAGIFVAAGLGVFYASWLA